MASPSIVFPPPPWLNQDIIVYHGTVDTFAAAIVSGPILVNLGKPGTDFGPGFYTTTLKRQAQMWAAQISATRPGTKPAVIEIRIKRPSLGDLETVAFVRGDFDADDRERPASKLFVSNPLKNDYGCSALSLATITPLPRYSPFILLYWRHVPLRPPVASCLPVLHAFSRIMALPVPGSGCPDRAAAATELR